MEITQNMIEWLANGERGCSSEAIFTKITGINACSDFHGVTDIPHDPADFRRCHLLLEKCPELKLHLHKMRYVSLDWKALVDNWEELTDMLGRRDPNMYTFMKSLRKEA